MEQEIVKKKPSFKKFINKLIHMKYFNKPEHCTSGATVMLNAVLMADND